MRKFKEILESDPVTKVKIKEILKLTYEASDLIMELVGIGSVHEKRLKMAHLDVQKACDDLEKIQDKVN